MMQTYQEIKDVFFNAEIGDIILVRYKDDLTENTFKYERIGLSSTGLPIWKNEHGEHKVIHPKYLSNCHAVEVL